MNTSNSVLTVDKLQKSFGSSDKRFIAVNDLSFSVAKGECYGLLGPNGAGKSTTMKLLLGLLSAEAGQINCLGYSIPLQAREARFRIGVVPQMDSLDPDFSVKENLRVYGRYFGLSDSVIDQRMPSLLEFAQLESKENANIRELSGGMKRRLTIARALVNDPSLLVLDEPTTGLDPQARHLIWDRLKTLLNRGKTILITTHFMDEAERLCDRLSIIDHGKKIAEDAPTALIEREITPYVIELVGDGLNAWHQMYSEPWQSLMPSNAKLERVGDTGYVYCENPIEMMQLMNVKTPLLKVRAIQRAANLEDVFLKLTGRDLRD